MKLLIRFFAATLLVAGSLAAQEQFVGKWAGSTETVDDVNVHRYERHTIELKMENGKLVAGQVGRNGNSSPMEVQVDGNKVNLYRFLPADGGEPLRWKLELKDGKLVGLLPMHAQQSGQVAVRSQRRDHFGEGRPDSPCGEVACRLGYPGK